MSTIPPLPISTNSLSTLSSVPTSNVIPIIKSGSTVREFYDLYFSYVGSTEAPRIFHRWCAISGIAALLERQCWLPFGHGNIYPNMYVMLMGSPGTRKDTSINIIKHCLERQGFSRFSADRTSKERFLMDMRSSCFGDVDDTTEEEFLELPLDINAARYIVAGEFLDFAGKGNIEFITMLGKLWDNIAVYDHPKLHGRSITLNNPTVNMLAGNTPQNFALAVPAEATGSGFMSRILLIHGETTGVKITFPESPSESSQHALDAHITQIMTEVRGAFTLSQAAQDVCTRLYKGYTDIEDHRFAHYSTRRFTHLLKLVMCFTAARVSTEISYSDVVQANTLLYYTEARMPKALGEYGKSRNSDVSNTVLDIVRRSKVPINATRIWKSVAQDLNRQEEMSDILKSLTQVGKIKSANGGFVPHYEKTVVWEESLLDKSFLTWEEMT